MTSNIDYVNAVGIYFPGSRCYSTGDNSVYENLVWESTPISKEELDTTFMAEVKTNKIIELSVAAEDEILNGFVSNALGTTHLYDSEPEDQVNLIGSVASGDDMYYATRDTSTNVKEYKFYTHEQLVQVLQAGRDIKLSVLQRFNDKRNQVLNASSFEEIDAVTWMGSP